MRAFVCTTLAAALTVVAACSDDDDGASGGTDASGADAGAPEDAGGANGGVECVEPVDAGPPLFPCNPIDGTRCELSTGTRCVLNPSTDEGECVCLAGALPFGAACDPTAPVCAPGLVCLQLVGEDGPTCKKVCEFETGEGCRDIDPSGVEAYECGGLADPNGGPGAAVYGICIFVGESCDLLENDCPSNQTCTITGNQTACVGVGNQPPGEPCGLSQRCERGLVCTAGPEDVRPECKVVCDPDLPEDPCPTGQRCRAFADFSGGICSTQ